MSDIKTLAQKLEEAYQDALKIDQFQGASLSPACTGFFEAVASKVEMLDVHDPVRVALVVHETLYTDQGSWQTTHHITPVDLGILLHFIRKMFEVICGEDATKTTAAFVAFESFQTGRVGGEPITGH